MTKPEARAQLETMLRDFAELRTALTPVHGEIETIRVPTRLMRLLVDQMQILADFLVKVVEGMPD